MSYIKTNISFQATFSCSYLRNNRSSGQKSIRCFPQCSDKKGHRDSGFCGRSIDVNIAMEKSSEFVFDWKTMIVIQDIHVSNNPTMRINERLNKNELLPTVRFDASVTAPGQYNYWNGNIDLVYEDPNAIELVATFNSRLRSWDYDWSSNRWKGEEKHVVEVYVLVEIDSETFIVVGMGHSSEFQITSNKTNTLRNKISGKELICSEVSCENSNSFILNTQTSSNIKIEKKNVIPKKNKIMNHHLSAADANHPISAAATLATLSLVNTCSPSTISKVNSEINNSFYRISSSQEDLQFDSYVFPFDELREDSVAFQSFSPFIDASNQDFKKPRSASACASYSNPSVLASAAEETNSTVYKNVNIVSKPRSASVAVSSKEKQSTSSLSLEEVGELLVNLKETQSGILYACSSLINPLKFSFDVEKARERVRNKQDRLKNEQAACISSQIDIEQSTGPSYHSQFMERDLLKSDDATADITNEGEEGEFATELSMDDSFESKKRKQSIVVF